jgi:DNA-binding transcriptional LysR family regulator
VELRHLRYFVAVAEEASFTRAARRLSMAQSPLSHQIQQLEATVGARLFDRTSRQVRLTAAGSVLLTRARALLRQADEAIQVTRSVGEGRAGSVSVACVGSATYELLPLLARAVATRLPEVDLQIHGETLAREQVRGLRLGRIDIGILRPPIHDDYIAVEHLRWDELVVALPPGHRLVDEEQVDLAELKEERFISYGGTPPTSTYEATIHACLEAGFEPDIYLPVSETSSLVNLVAAELGVALVPSSVAHLRVAGIEYRPLSGPSPRLSLAIATRSDETSPLVANCIAVLRELFGGQAARGR